MTRIPADVADATVPAAGQGSGATPAGRSPWVIGIIIGFVVMLVMNAVFITIAVKGADTVVPSYETADR
jgi:hypothetical protein